MNALANTSGANTFHVHASGANNVFINNAKSGWLCRGCKTMWNPDIEKCPKCTVEESEPKDTKQLLLE